MTGPTIDMLQLGTIGSGSTVGSTQAGAPTPGAATDLFAELLAAVTTTAPGQQGETPNTVGIETTTETEAAAAEGAEDENAVETETTEGDEPVPVQMAYADPAVVEQAAVTITPQAASAVTEQAVETSVEPAIQIDAAVTQVSQSASQPSVDTQVVAEQLIPESLPVQQTQEDTPVQTAVEHQDAQPVVQQDSGQTPQASSRSRTSENVSTQAQQSTSPEQSGVDTTDQPTPDDMFNRWNRDGRLTVNVERNPQPQPVVEMTQSGRIVAEQLLGSFVAPEEVKQPGLQMGTTSEKKAINGPDFSVRGSAFQINSGAVLVNPGAGTAVPVQSGLPYDPLGVPTVQPVTQSVTTGQVVNDHVHQEAIPLELNEEHIQGNHGFSALLNSQGPAHAASGKPSEVISHRAELADRVIDRIVSDVKLRIKDDGGHITLRLDPPELGQVRVEIVSREGGVTASLRSSSETVRSLLESNLPALRDALTQAGIKVDSFNVSSGLDFSQFSEHKGETWQRQGHAYHTQNMQNDLDPTAGAILSMRAPVGSAAAYNWLA